MSTADATLSIFRAGFSAVVDKLFYEGRRTYSACLRSGLIAAVCAHGLGRWCLSPVSGGMVLDDLIRLLAVGRRDEDIRKLRHIYQFDDADFPIEVGGNLLSYAMAEDLMGDSTTAQVGGIGIPTRVLRLEGETRDAHRFVPGIPLWRRAEPSNDLIFTETLADDIADWIATCEG